jgi:hypothetical protein
LLADIDGGKRLLFPRYLATQIDEVRLGKLDSAGCLDQSIFREHVKGSQVEVWVAFDAKIGELDMLDAGVNLALQLGKSCLM